MTINNFLTASIASLFAFTVMLETAIAQTYHYQSGVQKNQLIELYTSQGCSSCPPAEHLLSKLVESNLLFKRYFPIALHVDYWNHLGWSDTYSNSHANQRQQQHFKQSNTSNIYTPQFVVDGNEWRGFFRAAPFPALTQQQAGQLSLQVDDATGSAGMHFTQTSSNTPAFCHFALLAFDPNVMISAGENKGLSLSQDFAMLEIQTSPAEFRKDHYKCDAKLSKLAAITATDIKASKHAVVSWVASQMHNPIQVTGGWIDAANSK